MISDLDHTSSGILLSLLRLLLFVRFEQTEQTLLTQVGHRHFNHIKAKDPSSTCYRNTPLPKANDADFAMPIPSCGTAVIHIKDLAETASLQSRIREVSHSKRIAKQEQLARLWGVCIHFVSRTDE
jgi:hypothetical protein